MSDPDGPAEEQHFLVTGAAGDYTFGTPIEKDDGSGQTTGGDFAYSDNIEVGPRIGLRISGASEGDAYDVTFTFEI